MLSKTIYTNFLIHPECGCSSNCMLKSLSMPKGKINIYSTETMGNHIQNNNTDEYVVATATGILHRLIKYAPNKKIIQPAKIRSVRT